MKDNQDGGLGESDDEADERARQFDGAQFAPRDLPDQFLEILQGNLNQPLADMIRNVNIFRNTGQRGIVQLGKILRQPLEDLPPEYVDQFLAHVVHGGQAWEFAGEEIAGDLSVQGLGDDAVQVFFQRNRAEQIAGVLGGEKVLVERPGQAVRQGFPASGNDALPLPEQEANRPAGPEEHPECDVVGPPTDQRANQGKHNPEGQGFGKSFLR